MTEKLPTLCQAWGCRVPAVEKGWCARHFRTLDAPQSATDPDSTSVVPAVDRSRSYPDVAAALTPLPAAPQGIAGDVTTPPCANECGRLATMYQTGLCRECQFGSSAGERAPDGETPSDPRIATDPSDATDRAARRLKAELLIGKLCKGDRWHMSIPVHRDDSDILLSAVVADSRWLESSLGQFEARVAAVTEIANARVRDVERLRASLATAQQALLTAHEDRAKAEGERDALQKAAVMVCESETPGGNPFLSVVYSAAVAKLRTALRGGTT